MRVLMFGWEFPPYAAGGLATATLGLVKGLLQQNVDVTLVVPFPVDEETHSAGVKLLAGVPSTKHHVTRRVRSLLSPYMGHEEYTEVLRTRVKDADFSVYGKDMFMEVDRFADAAAEIAVEEPCDVIHSHDWMTYPAAIAASQATGLPHIAHIHSTEFDRSGEAANPDICRVEYEGLVKADVVIANSHYLKDQVVRHYGVPERKVQVVHWGVEQDRPEYQVEPPRPFREGCKVVLFLGRVTRQKGPDYFIKVARIVADYVPDVHFIVAGSGDMLPQVMDAAVELDISDRVHFTGSVQGEDVYRLFRMADVCVMPSVSEPFGLVALESLKCGTPVIVPKQSGVSEVVEHVFKEHFWDVEEMANKVVALLKYEPLHEEMVEQSSREVCHPRLGLAEPARMVSEIYERAARARQGV